MTSAESAARRRRLRQLAKLVATWAPHVATTPRAQDRLATIGVVITSTLGKHGRAHTDQRTSHD
jgi:hypothetical protein